MPLGLLETTIGKATEQGKLLQASLTPCYSTGSDGPQKHTFHKFRTNSGFRKNIGYRLYSLEKAATVTSTIIGKRRVGQEERCAATHARGQIALEI
eukprot:COSAG01_NODE_233_length_20982_cov_14.774458_4_plen_96_part_00